MSENTAQNLSPQAMEAIKMINQLATDIMFKAYDECTPGMKMRVANITKCTQDMLEKERPID